ncbi:MAG: hypothetical protein MJ182_09565 [Treponema sp.]|nr:hypothetical protein [Treponema sp.]
MKLIISDIKERLSYLKKLEVQAEKSLKENSLEGRIKINSSSKYPQVYLITKPNDTGGKYLGKKDSKIISRYCQRDYNRHVLKKVQKLINGCEKFLNNLPSELSSASLENFLSEKNPVRRKFLPDPVLSDDEFVKEWLSVKYKGKSFSENNGELTTDRGERVRSKSEILIANKLASLGIPYRYEFPHKLRDRHGFKITVYPDFTLLNKETRKEIILEHFGRMDDPEYVSHTLEKLSLYGRNGIFPGNRFLFTTETSRHSFDMRLFEKQLKAAGVI